MLWALARKVSKALENGLLNRILCRFASEFDYTSINRSCDGVENLSVGVAQAQILPSWGMQVSGDTSYRSESRQRGYS